MFAIKEMRQRAGLTQAQVAEVLGMSTKGYYKWEHEERDISMKDAITLARLFDCTLDELAGRTTPSGQSLAADERHLVDSYRATDDRGKATIKAIADSQRN